ncbi:MAG TPA: hypothetical protein VF469_02980 [Kofleriaceae bacterium]
MEADHALALAVAAFVLDVEIHAPVQILRDEARQPDWIGQREALAVDPSCTNPRVMDTTEAHDERSTVIANGLEVLNARIPAVCEEQAVL